MLNSPSLTIGELAKRTGASVPTIRYYEEIALLPKAVRRPGGHRMYGERELRALHFIKRCREFGFSIEQVRELISLSHSQTRDCMETRDIAQIHLETVREKLAELQALEASLESFVAHCNEACAGGPAAECTILDDLASPAPATGCCQTANAGDRTE
jgi:MerR family copper efflux transcriptional regulator